MRLNQERPAAFAPWASAFGDDALRRAWLAVRANRGAAGADGATWGEFERKLPGHLAALRRELLEGSYRPQRVTQVLVPKGGDEWRPISLWAIRDRVAQRAVYNYLEGAFEARFRPCSYGFRPGRTTATAAEAVGRARRAGARWVVDADIKECFGSMDSERLLRQLAGWQVPEPIRGLIGRWLRARVWNGWAGRRAAGTSQGGVISPLLCNVYLHPFDVAMAGRGRTLVRYADDFVVLTGDERAARAALARATAELERLGLAIHPQKTRITCFDEGFQFVGWFFVRDEMYLLR
jgi:group II intron reverse transcriptase/maturase